MPIVEPGTRLTVAVIRQNSGISVKVVVLEGGCPGT
jgi:hypothetical protein